MRAEVAATPIRKEEMKLSHAELTRVQPAVAPVTCDLNNKEAVRVCPVARVVPDGGHDA